MTGSASPPPSPAEALFASLLQQAEQEGGDPRPLLAEARAARPDLAGELLRLEREHFGFLVSLLREEETREADPGGPLARLRERLAEAARLGRYEILGSLGEGGMGEVLRVRDRILPRELARKGPRRGGPSDPRADAFLVGEAERTAALDHPGVVPVHDLGLDEEGRPWFTMRELRGRTLAQILAERREGEEGLGLPAALRVLLTVCETAAFAHTRGVVHRDLKPANILVGPFGETWVLDWGLAEDRSAAGVAAGTPDYMAPEQARGEAPDPRNDVWSVGAILHELLHGRPPWQEPGRRRSPAEILELLARGAEPPPPPAAPGAPPALQALAASCLRAEPAERPRDLGVVAARLRAWLDARVQAWPAYRAGLAAAEAALRDFDPVSARHFLTAVPREHAGWELDHLEERLRERSLAVLRDWKRALRVVRFHPRRPWLLTASWDGRVRLLPVPGSGAEAPGWTAVHRAYVTCAAWGPGEEPDFVVSGGYDARLQVVSAGTGEILAVLEAGERLASLAVHPERPLVAAGDYAGRILLWDPLADPEGRALRFCGPGGRAHPAPVQALAFQERAEGLRLVSGAWQAPVPGGEPDLLLWDPEAPEAPAGRLRGHTGSLWGLRASPDRRRLASGDETGTILLWGPEGERPCGRLQGHAGRVADLAFSAQGTRLASASWDRTVRLWDLDPAGGGRERALLEGHGSWVWSVDLGAEGEELRVASGSNDASLRLWDGSLRGRAGLLEGFPGLWVYAVALEPGAGSLLAGDAGGRLHRVLLGRDESGAPCIRGEEVVFRGPGRVLDLAFLAGGSRWLAAVASGPEGEGQLLLGEGGHVLERRPLPRAGDPTLPCRLAVAADGSAAALPAEDGRILRWHLPSLEEAPPLDPGAGRLLALAGEPEGRLWCGALDGRILEVQGSAAVERGRHAEPVTDLALSPDGRRLASASWDRRVLLHAVDGAAGARSLEGHATWVMALAWSADGRRLLSAGADGSLLVWNPGRAEAVAAWRAHRDGIAGLDLDARSGWLASGGIDGAWRVRPGRPDPGWQAR